MMSFFDGLQDAGRISLVRRENMLAGGASFYRTYQCRDGREVAIGSLDTNVYHELLELFLAPVILLPSQYDTPHWADRGAIPAPVLPHRPRISLDRTENRQ